MTRRRVVRSGSDAFVVSIEHDGRVRVNDTDLTVAAAGPGQWRVVDAGGRAHLAYAARSSEGVWVHLDGRVFLLEIGNAARADARKPPETDGNLTAPMPATVLSVRVQPGAKISAGETLLVLEAMKMELPIRAPRDGVVRAVHCREGELVQPGVVLVDLS
ncbi:MAG TPA: biotin/lipoyl-containing protein [Vicinamibacterales bacterium]|nr:biotin/lipoyl-containing protein [Vicinamibacterales bacterium]